MIWLNIEKLEEDISNDKLSEKDGFNYVLAYFIATTISVMIGSDNMSGSIRLLGAVIFVIITIWGLNAIYKINLELDGKDFFKRFFAISRVVGMRVFVAALKLMLIVGIIIGILSTNSDTISLENNPVAGLIQVFFTAFIAVISYLMMMNSFRKLKPKTK